MYRDVVRQTSSFKGIQPFEGDSLETSIQKFKLEGGDIEMGSPLLYTKKSDGVLPQTDIRTDRFEMAQSRMQAALEAEQAQRLKKKAERDAKVQEGVESPAEAAKTAENGQEAGSGNPTE